MITVKKLFTELSQNQRDVENVPVVVVNKETGQSFTVDGWDNEKTDVFELHVSSPPPAEKMNQAMSMTDFAQRGRFILKTGLALYDSIPLPVGAGDVIFMDNMKFEKRAETDGVSVYYEIT